MQAIDEIVPTLLHALEDDQTSDTALDGLKQILRSVLLSFMGLLIFFNNPVQISWVLKSIYCSLQR